MPVKKKTEEETASVCCRGGWDKWVLLILIFLLATGLVWNYITLLKTKQELADYQNPAKQQELEKASNLALLNELRGKMELPTDEPSIATVTNAAELKKQQSFFDTAQDGDKLFIFKDKAIIYRPSSGQVVKAGPVYVMKGDELGPSLEIRNGSQTQGVAAELSDKLKAQGGWSIKSVDNASSDEYQGTLIVNLKNVDMGTLPTELSATVTSTLPQDEKASEADAVIIIGN